MVDSNTVLSALAPGSAMQRCMCVCARGRRWCMQIRKLVPYARATSITVSLRNMYHASHTHRHTNLLEVGKLVLELFLVAQMVALALLHCYARRLLLPQLRLQRCNLLLLQRIKL